MTASVVPDVFVDLLSATVRGARTFHRLEHLGRRNAFTFHEETVTDLLVAEMAGKAYDIDAACPLCPTGVTCADWDGARRGGGRGIRVRALTKVEEGGNRRYRKKGVHADFAVTARDRDPDLPGRGPEFRMLVQAKAVRPGATFLNIKKERDQYDKLAAAATACAAAPFYALYVRQPDSHASSPTLCAYHATAADRAVVLVPAGSSTAGDLRRRPVADVLAAGRPLRCLGGCHCVASPRAVTAYDAVRGFISAAFPGQDPAPQGTPGPAGVPRVDINAAKYRLGAAPAGRGRDRDHDGESLLVVRLGRQAPSPDPGRDHIGYSAAMTPDELRDAARMYWRLDPDRARALTHLVAASGNMPLEAYSIVPDSLTYTTSADGSRRASFDLVEIAPGRVRDRLLGQAGQSLRGLARGAQNPVLYSRG